MKKITIITIAIALSTMISYAQNIYVSDGALTGNRIVTMGSRNLVFSSEGSFLESGNTSLISGFVLRAATGGKILNKGVSLEFALPANTDGSNFWSVGRIITLPGSTGSQNAVGKMVLGTRRHFNKYNSGSQWYYGDDITIDGAGNIGIGTLEPKSKLDVRGKVIANEVEIKINIGADFVFEADYQLPKLSEVESFIKENKHLPEIPSEKQMKEDGVSVNELQIKLLQKIEELTLYVIEQDKKIKELEQKLDNK